MTFRGTMESMPFFDSAFSGTAPPHCNFMHASQTKLLLHCLPTLGGTLGRAIRILHTQELLEGVAEVGEWLCHIP